MISQDRMTKVRGLLGPKSLSAESLSAPSEINDSILCEKANNI